MGHSHGKIWKEIEIAKGIKYVMDVAGIDTMPNQSITKNIMGDTSLNNAISRSGGFIFWANKLGIKNSGIETMFGVKFEKYCADFIIENFDLDVQKMNAHYPYDLLVSENIKIDVKAGRKYRGKFSFYTFNLEKRFPTCDIFVAYCVSDNNEIIKTYVIPSKILYGITQLSVGINQSKYDKYLDAWEVIDKYNEFYKTLV